MPARDPRRALPARDPRRGPCISVSRRTPPERLVDSALPCRLAAYVVGNWLHEVRRQTPSARRVLGAATQILQPPAAFGAGTRSHLRRDSAASAPALARPCCILRDHCAGGAAVLGALRFAGGQVPRALLQSLVLLGVAHATVALNPGARYDRSRFVRVCLEDAHTHTYTHAQAHAHARKHTLTRTRTLVIPASATCSTPWSA